MVGLRTVYFKNGANAESLMLDLLTDLKVRRLMRDEVA